MIGVGMTQEKECSTFKTHKGLCKEGENTIFLTEFMERVFGITPWRNDQDRRHFRVFDAHQRLQSLAARYQRKLSTSHLSVSEFCSSIPNVFPNNMGAALFRQQFSVLC